jgi:hypothetical protein
MLRELDYCSRMVHGNRYENASLLYCRRGHSTAISRDRPTAWRKSSWKWSTRWHQKPSRLSMWSGGGPRAPQSSARSTRTGMGVPPAHLWFHLRACNSCVRGRPSHTTSNAYRLVAYCRTGVCYLSGHLGSLTAVCGHKNGQGIAPDYHLLAKLLHKSSIMVPRVPGCGRDLW